MFTFISIMAVGVLIGYPLRHKSQVRKITSSHPYRGLSATFLTRSLYWS